MSKSIEAKGIKIKSKQSKEIIMLQNIEAVIFDLDGSLVDSMWIWRQIDIAYLGSFGISLPDNLQKEIEGMSFTETAEYFKERFQLPCSIEEIKQTWNDMSYEKYTKEVPLKAGVREFLAYCRAHDIILAIATSNSRKACGGGTGGAWRRPLFYECDDGV